MNTWPAPGGGRAWWWRRGTSLAGSFDPPLVLFLCASLLVRVLTDDLSAPDSRHTGSLNLSSVIAVAFILIAAYTWWRRRRSVLPTVLALLWLCVWMAIAVNTSGASGETLREGVRELSVLALFVLVYNARGGVRAVTAARVVQLVGFVPALLAVYQLATQTGMNIHGEIRAHGTFAHPNSAAMFFAIATATSLWIYLEKRRHWGDAALTGLFAAALIATFSIDGLATLTAMLLLLGALRPGSLRAKFWPCAIAAAIVVVFFALPLGAKRIASETATSVSAAERGETTSTLDTRLYRWKTLLPEWEKSPLVGQGLGTTTTAENTTANPLNSLLPHNEYIRYFVETGVIGVAILLSALALLVRALIRIRRRSRADDADGFASSTLALTIVAGCLVNSLADNTLLNSPTCYAAALLIAAALSVSSAHTRAPTTEPRLQTV
jgi:O-antigen ligase